MLNFGSQGLDAKEHWASLCYKLQLKYPDDVMRHIAVLSLIYCMILKTFSYLQLKLNLDSTDHETFIDKILIESTYHHYS